VNILAVCSYQANSHVDNNENILIQVSGTKKFRLFSPGQREFLYAVARGFPSAVSSDINGTILALNVNGTIAKELLGRYCKSGPRSLSLL